VTLVTAILFGFAFTSSVCPGDICNSTYSDKGAIIRVDDGDVFIPKYFINSTGNMTNSNMTNNCTNYNAYCISNSTEGCSACKCKLLSPTWRDDQNGCKDSDIKDGYYVFDRSGLEVDTPVTTVYFVQNSNNNYELQSTETGTSLPLVRNSNGNDIRDSDGCSVYKLYIMTPGGFEQIDDNGFTLVETNQKYYIEVSNLKLSNTHTHIDVYYLVLISAINQVIAITNYIISDSISFTFICHCRFLKVKSKFVLNTSKGNYLN
jgi:hypothetical protein